MTHVDPAHMVELALGTSPSHEATAALRHLAACPACREELTRIAKVVDIALSVEASDLTVAPPEWVWRGIKRTLSTEPAPPPVGEADQASPPRAADPPRRTPGQALETGHDSRPAPRRRRRIVVPARWIPLVVLVCVGAGWWLTRRRRSRVRGSRSSTP